MRLTQGAISDSNKAARLAVLCGVLCMACSMVADAVSCLGVLPGATMP